MPFVGPQTPAAAAPTSQQTGFALQRIFGGYSSFTQPVGVRFAPDGTVFVAERTGL